MKKVISWIGILVICIGIIMFGVDYSTYTSTTVNNGMGADIVFFIIGFIIVFISKYN